MSVANTFRPRLWKDFSGDSIGTDYLKGCIRNNRHPSAILISGPPGSGKSTLAQLYTRATLCINRKEGQIEGCGECDICTGKDTSNITYYLVQDSTKAKDNIERLVDTSYTKPCISEGVREDQYRRFIVVDETELIHPTTISALLNPLEYPPSTTTWVLISMDTSKLPIITREAIESRCKEIRIKPLPIDQIKELLVSKNGVNEEIALLVSKFCNSNIRRAWSLVEMIGDKTVEEVRSYFLGGATEENRRVMWSALSDGEVHKVTSLVKSWEDGGDPESLVSLLMEDLISMESPPLDLIKSLAAWSKSSYKYPIAAVLYPYRSFYREKENKSVEIDMSKKVLPIGTVSSDYSKGVLDLIKSRTSTKDHPFKGSSSISGLIERYVMDNV